MNKEIDFYWLHSVKKSNQIKSNKDQEQESARNLIQA